MADPLTLAAAAGATVVVAAAATITFGVAVPQSSMFGPVHARAPHGHAAHAAALTFDDGPWPGSTDAILDALAATGGRATFFVIGRYAANHPALVRRIHAEGHQLGNHTYSHSRLGMFRGLQYWIDEIDRTNDTISSITGSAPTVFRPPMGLKSPLVMHAARAAGLRVVAWSVRARDGVTSGVDQIERRLGAVQSGDIVLLHDGRDPASARRVGAAALATPRVLRAMGERGLQSVRVDELLAHADLSA
jgi:peptidoglycan/xylan/chitin deacetylase (PgdA/CDA1 family)